MSQINVLGPVGYNPTGEYDNTKNYEKLDVVYYEGSSYVALKSSIGQLPTNTEYWNPIAIKGDPGNVIDVQVDGISAVSSGVANIVGLTEMMQELEDVYNLLPKTNGTGETVTLNDTVAGKMTIGLKGNIHQNTTNGVQLFDFSDVINGYFTSDAGGTNTSADGFRTQQYIEVPQNSKIYSRFEALKDCKLGRFWIQEFDENKNSLARHSTGIYDTAFTAGQVKKFSTTLNENTKYIMFSAYKVLKFEEGSYVNLVPEKDYWNSYMKATFSYTDVDYYEPYTNGVSPNPDFPQSISVAKSNNTITITNSDNTASQDYSITLPTGLELCKIGTAQDYIYKSNGNWYKHTEINKIDLDGSFSVTDKRDNTILFLRQLSSPRKGNFICDYFTDVGYTNISQDKEFIANGSGYTTRLYLSVKKSRLTGYSDDLSNSQLVLLLKTYLQSISSVVYYAYNVIPADTQITDSTLINQLEAIKRSYNVQTNVTQTNADLPFILDVTALEQLTQ